MAVTAGIPARTVGTQPWAHQDGAHYWSEAYVGGQWHYFGPCDPEPVLNKNWVTTTAQRAMLIKTFSIPNLQPDDEEIIAGSQGWGFANRTAAYVPQHTKLKVRLLNATPKTTLTAALWYGAAGYISIICG